MSHGLRVGPYAEFSVEEPIANSSVFVLPRSGEPGGAGARGDRRVEHRHVVLEDLRAGGRAHALGRDHVLERDRNPVAVGPVGEREEGVELAVPGVDRSAVGVPELARGDLAGLYRPPKELAVYQQAPGAAPAPAPKLPAALIVEDEYDLQLAVGPQGLLVIEVTQEAPAPPADQQDEVVGDLDDSSALAVLDDDELAVPTEVEETPSGRERRKYVRTIEDTPPSDSERRALGRIAIRKVAVGSSPRVMAGATLGEATRDPPRTGPRRRRRPGDRRAGTVRAGVRGRGAAGDPRRDRDRLEGLRARRRRRPRSRCR